MTATWSRIDPKRCDVCNLPARWEHPAGGLRCDACPRPLDGIDAYNTPWDYLVACPDCGAAVGEPCRDLRTLFGKPMIHSHAARKRLARSTP